MRRGELQELKPNKFAICSFEPNTKNYDVQKFPLESGDTLFLATDGFVDQFGGPHGKSSCVAASGSCWWKRPPCR